MEQTRKKFLPHLASKGAYLYKTSHQVGGFIFYIPPEIGIMEFLYAGTGFPIVANASPCIGSSAPMHKIYIDLKGTIRLTSGQFAKAYNASLIADVQAPIIKTLREELTVA
jgi:hypothetical protein